MKPAIPTVAHKYLVVSVEEMTNSLSPLVEINFFTRDV
jgi:hypothetical protein